MYVIQYDQRFLVLGTMSSGVPLVVGAATGGFVLLIIIIAIVVLVMKRCRFVSLFLAFIYYKPCRASKHTFFCLITKHLTLNVFL